MSDPQNTAGPRTQVKWGTVAGLLITLRIALVDKRFSLAAFLVPLLVRTIPEIVAGPYPIGYDTITAYVPLMRDWASGDTASQFNPTVGGWLMFTVFGLTYSTTRVDPIMIAKIAAPILYGALGLSEYLLSRRVLGWSQSKSLLLVLIASLYFVSLRVSWDLFRNTLGLSLMLCALVLWKQAGSSFRLVEFAAMSLLVTAAHLLVATILVAIVVLQALTTRNGPDLRKTLAVAPAGAWCVLSLFGLAGQGLTILANNQPEVQTLATYAYPVYIFLPLLPVAFFGSRRLRPNFLKIWLIVCSLGVLLSATPLGISTQIVTPDRWAQMMFLPLTVLSAEGLLTLKNHSWLRPRVGQRIALGWLLLLVILASVYVGLQPQQAFPYYAYFQPTSMLQSTIPVQYSGSLANAFKWLSINALQNSVIVAPSVVYGWAREYFTGKAAILGSTQETSIQAMLQTALDEGSSSVYVVWWASNQGWGDPTLPPGFVLVHQEAPFGVFLYSE